MLNIRTAYIPQRQQIIWEKKKNLKRNSISFGIKLDAKKFIENANKSPNRYFKNKNLILETFFKFMKTGFDAKPYPESSKKIHYRGFNDLKNIGGSKIGAYTVELDGQFPNEGFMFAKIPWKIFDNEKTLKEQGIYCLPSNMLVLGRDAYFVSDGDIETLYSPLIKSMKEKILSFLFGGSRDGLLRAIYNILPEIEEVLARKLSAKQKGLTVGEIKPLPVNLVKAPVITEPVKDPAVRAYSGVPSNVPEELASSQDGLFFIKREKELLEMAGKIEKLKGDYQNLKPEDVVEQFKILQQISSIHRKIDMLDLSVSDLPYHKNGDLKDYKLPDEIQEKIDKARSIKDLPSTLADSYLKEMFAGKI